MRQIVPEVKDPVILVSDVQKTLTGGIISFVPDAHEFDVRRSVINGDADIVSRGEYASGTIDMLSISNADYLIVKALQGTVVRLWPFGTGGIPSTAKYYPYLDVIITRVYPYHRNKIYYLDACIIEFVSENKYTLQRASDTGMPSPQDPD
ncbi:MAG: hypothetical protein PHC50_04325 [Candidatus Cloacimonetes bacterium]|nr:hypothetical protein [Candidatus Cloacimonadota bacterium]